MGRLLSGLAIFAVAYAHSVPTRAVDGPFPPFAVVELFTSEACSSCPPAERIFSELVARAAARQQPVYGLAFHVDYFNGLGWTDPFSSADSTARQNAYQRFTRTGEVYTPQLIVNGTHELVGAERSRAGTEVDAALARPATAGIEIELDAVATALLRQGESAGPAGVTVSYSVVGAPRRAVLNLALVESGLTSHVSSGENSGRTLTHDNVVRAFVTVPLRSRPTGTATLVIPAGVVAGHASIIGFVQDPSSMAILGAAASALSTGPH